MRIKQALNNVKAMPSTNYTAASIERQHQSLESEQKRLAELLEEVREATKGLKYIQVNDNSKQAFSGMTKAVSALYDSVSQLSKMIVASHSQLCEQIQGIEFDMPEMEEREEAEKAEYSFNVIRDKAGRIQKVEAKPV